MVHGGRLRQPEIDYQDPLDDFAREWLRVRIWHEAGQVLRFVVQYETTIASTRIPVVRYDTAHGVPHRDRLNRRGVEVAKDFMHDYLSLADALVHAERDVRENWRRYREAFLKDEP
jgi:hypothetical protein